MSYVGIDLGTTNSAIATYDGENVRLYKSPEQHDVTPSAIYVDPRGNRFVGSRAYQNAARDPDRAATLFKRLMGTSTTLELPRANLRMTPEECSSEILRTMFNYLPPEIRESSALGTVVTVPAAFNQMEKAATLSATEMAGMGQVALMQEPVAAVMSVMRQRKTDGVFLVYDMGGGTLDIAVAESISGRVSLLACGGIEMCGGRDFDRMVLEQVIVPWLESHADLPDGWTSDDNYKSLLRFATWAGEKAKIELSGRTEAIVSLSESETGIRDRSGADIYIDATLSRVKFDEMIGPKVEESIESAKETLAKAGLTSRDVERIVFVGGPTHYPPLREKVAHALGIAPSTEVNPMTAVAEGAAVFAESIDWSSESRGRKSARGTTAGPGPSSVSFNFVSRTPDTKARVMAKDVRIGDGAQFQIDNLDTGWSSGRMPLKEGATIDVTLSKPGENTFKFFVFDGTGAVVSLANERIVITRTAASVDAIPASHSVGIEVKEKLGGVTVLDYLVREGDQLPVKGKKIYRAEESLKAGSPSALRFKLWEGEIKNPISDNRPIGTFKISGSDFPDGVIAAGAELVCEYEISDSGNVKLGVSVPSIGGLFNSQQNFYSRQEGQIDYSNASKLVADQSEAAANRLDEIAQHVSDTRLDTARQKIRDAQSVQSDDKDPEVVKQAMDRIQEAKQLLARVRQDHLKAMRQIELDRLIAAFNETVKQYARPSEVTAFENLTITAKRSIDSGSSDFESRLDEMWSNSFRILWRQDWFVIDRFKSMATNPHKFPNAAEHRRLVAAGSEFLRANDIDKLREVVFEMDSVRFSTPDDDDLMSGANIVRG
ncbi:MAG TPA: Hsp70 family protein [Gemmatimonadaceae bacterium]|nr:Hsp70 family protein [Gemmatimonadaceae bacterium]